MYGRVVGGFKNPGMKDPFSGTRNASGFLKRPLCFKSVQKEQADLASGI